MPIIGGVVHSGDEAVLPLLVNFPVAGDPGAVTQSLCTGALIAPRVVLTAKHCICDPAQDRLASPSNVAVGVGPSIEEAFLYSRVAEIRAAGGPCPGAATVGGDIAVLLLEQAGDLEPYSTGSAPRVGDNVIAMGYGSSIGGLPPETLPPSASGLKMLGQATIITNPGIPIAANEFVIDGPTACYGDSGGPIFRDGEILGVVSRGVDFCTGESIITSVGGYVALLSTAMEDTEDGGAPSTSPDSGTVALPVNDPTPAMPAINRDASTTSERLQRGAADGGLGVGAVPSTLHGGCSIRQDDSAFTALGLLVGLLSFLRRRRRRSTI